MPEDMWRDGFGDPCVSASVSDHHFYRGSGDSTGFAFVFKFVFSTSGIDKDWGEVVVSLGHVFFQYIHGFLREKNGSDFLSFSEDRELSGFEIDVFLIEIAEFGDSEACGEQHFYNGSVSGVDEFIFGRVYISESVEFVCI